ncbi:glycosyl hydrolase [Psychroflexus sp. YR1-1]|uniref:Glycosyl hydrolase n=1 Tax=Psychroflexus aurantiacus TaxID=2709310 RepID=A0A6B3R385_9FLAO|nr:glycosyl hydrolase [Psychroflexus aurantiacus]NEV93990.1 glycosyl hydrolase [Psychroflexus aurantiacus]
MKHISTLVLLVFSLVWLIPADAEAQRRNRQDQISFDASLYQGAIQWRNIGPFRGGRSSAVTGVANKPNLYYFGSSGGGVWRTQDGGQTWANISDGYFGGSIGAVAVSEWDPNVIYVGGGEKTVRGNVSYGYGVWKSVDEGKTWKQMGLENSRHISRIRIHPKNPDIVYAAVMGDLYKSTQERGVYRSKDGGETWERILFANADAGAVDLTFDPTNPRILYASTWRIRRTPYSLESGGEGSDLWKSTDAGDTWEKLTDHEGMAQGTLGIIGVAVSPANSERVWAIVEADEGGVFRSDNGGKTWKRINESRALRQRAWYYSRIYADPQDEDGVYVVNVNYHHSTDGGKTFTPSAAPHGDHHDMWIAPEDPSRMIMGDDGGAQVSFDGGANWSTYHNQPTAQFYRVTTDNAFPYRIYAAQQDNSTVRIAHRTSGNSIGEDDWEPTAGGESAHIAPDPENPEIVYGGSYGGYLTEYNHDNDEVRAINVWPDNPMGYGAEGMKYRFQWNFPIFFSPHNPDKLYTASNHLHVSTDGGASWDLISPDLTRNDPTKLKSSGGPITQDNTSVEYYCTIFAAVESPYEEGLIWTGSDDGLLHVTKDGGKSWENVTPKGMPEWMMFNSIDPDPFTKGGAYVAGTRYKLGDYRPYLYKTEDYGKTWKNITEGIDEEHFTRVVRADPKRKGLLYAGTETGMYISFDDGASWSPFQMNLPQVPITDLSLKNDNLIAATQGRSLWLIDDLTPLHQLSDEVMRNDFYLYKPMPSYRMAGGAGRPSKTLGENHPGGVMVSYHLKTFTDSTQVRLEFMDKEGRLIRAFDTQPDKEKNEVALEDIKKGGNRFVWDTRYQPASDFEGMILWWASMQGPKAMPGTYKVKMTVEGESSEREFEILKDPRASMSIADMQAKFEFLMKVSSKVTEAHEAIADMRSAKAQIKQVSDRLKSDENMKGLVEKAKDINEKITEVEKALYQTKNQSRQDPLNYPIKLTNKLAHLNSLEGMSDHAPTSQSEAFRKEVSAKIDAELASWQNIRQTAIPEFNAMVKQKSVDAVILESSSE